MKLIYLVILFIVIYILTDKNESHSNIYDRSKDCCFVEQKVGKNNKFYYRYSKRKCRPDFIGSRFNYSLISPDQIQLKNCNIKNKNLGSCRKDSRECRNFMTKENCDKYGMRWSKEPCLNPIDWKVDIPERKI